LIKGLPDELKIGLLWRLGDVGVPMKIIDGEEVYVLNLEESSHKKLWYETSKVLISL
jgi:hypothetical protein